MAALSETKNSVYEVEPVVMSNDAKIKGTKAPLPREYNFFMIMIGKPGSGKTTLWINLINKANKQTFYQKFDHVFIFTNSFGTISQEINVPDEYVFNGLDKLGETIDLLSSIESKKSLIVIDDCMGDIKPTDPVFTKLIANRRHIGGGVSIILTTQVFNRIPLAFRKMASDLIFFSSSNKKEIDSVFTDYSSLTKYEFQNVIHYCFKGGIHEFLWLDVRTEKYYHNFNLINFT